MQAAPRTTVLHIFAHKHSPSSCQPHVEWRACRQHLRLQHLHTQLSVLLGAGSQLSYATLSGGNKTPTSAHN